jgi:hypothetical protein
MSYVPLGACIKNSAEVSTTIVLANGAAVSSGRLCDNIMVPAYQN